MDESTEVDHDIAYKIIRRSVLSIHGLSCQFGSLLLGSSFRHPSHLWRIDSTCFLQQIEIWKSRRQIYFRLDPLICYKLCSVQQGMDYGYVRNYL